jgi:hypothetical protein
VIPEAARTDCNGDRDTIRAPTKEVIGLRTKGNVNNVRFVSCTL